MKKISILGSTGSIGTQTLEIVRKTQDIQVIALSCGKNIELLEQQAREFRPLLVCVENESLASSLRVKLGDLNIKVVHGMEGLKQVATHIEVELVVTALVGMVGIVPTIEAIWAGKDIALANKETLVCAGHLIMPLVKKHGVNLLPVDSEHSAIFQCLQGEEVNPIHKIILTASGGPFRGFTKEALSKVSKEQALKHPNWSMGHKITIDSATLVNKGLEVIEAGWLFDLSPESIEVLVQPESIIHSMVEFKDGSIKAQMGTPDMILPIAYALFYPKRMDIGRPKLSLSELSGLRMEKVDKKVFRGLEFAYQSMQVGGSLPAVFNAANEKAVDLFLHDKISFMQIFDIIEYAMSHHQLLAHPDAKVLMDLQKDINQQIESRW